MTAAYAGQYNTYLPALEKQAGDALVVDFSRNVKSFPLNKWVQIIPATKVTKNVGRYIEMTQEVAARVMNTTDSDHLWPDGNDRPSGRGNTEAFEFKGYVTKRRNFGFPLGDLAVEQASWNILAQHARIMSQLAMTVRAMKLVTLATTSGNYAATHTSAVSSITGVTGKWDVSTTARKDIKRSIDYASDIIFRDTLGGVDLDKKPLILVMSPGCARKMAVSQEIVDYLKGSPDALKEIKGELGPNSQYGLPQYLYGVELVIENTVRVTSRKGATKATSYVLGDTTPFICARPGALEGVEEAPSFSSFSLFCKEEMTVETFRSDEHRRTSGHVVEDYAEVFTAPVSAFLFTSAVAA